MGPRNTPPPHRMRSSPPARSIHVHPSSEPHHLCTKALTRCRHDEDVRLCESGFHCTHEVRGKGNSEYACKAAAAKCEDLVNKCLADVGPVGCTAAGYSDPNLDAPTPPPSPPSPPSPSPLPSPSPPPHAPDACMEANAKCMLSGAYVLCLVDAGCNPSEDKHDDDVCSIAVSTCRSIFLQCVEYMAPPECLLSE
jgi:hypothetical protein